MPQCQLSRPPLIQRHICDAFDLAMPSHGDHRQAHAMCQHCVDHNEPFNRPVQQHEWVFFDEVLFAAMARCQVEVAFLDEEILDARQHSVV